MRSMITPRIAAQKKDYSSTSVQSSAFGASTHLVRLVATTNCYVAFGTDPTADTSSLLLIANVPEFFGVKPGEKVAVLRSASDGTLSIAEGLA